MTERLQKVLAHAGVASRRAIEEMVTQGRITVNGKIVYALPVMVDPEKDKVKVDGHAEAVLKEIEERRFHL